MRLTTTPPDAGTAAKRNQLASDEDERPSMCNIVDQAIPASSPG